MYKSQAFHQFPSQNFILHHLTSPCQHHIPRSNKNPFNNFTRMI
jgi:hypothetical protein